MSYDDANHHGSDEHRRAMVRIHPVLIERVDSAFAGPGTPQHRRLVDDLATLAGDLHSEGPAAIRAVLVALITHIGLDHYDMALTEGQQYEVLEARAAHHIEMT